MKFYTIAIFMLCIQSAMGLIDLSGVFATSVTTDAAYSSNPEKVISDYNYTDTTLSGDISGGILGSVGDFIKGIWLFIKIFAKTTVLFPFLLHDFGLPWAIIGLLSPLIYAVYAIAIIQIISNRPGEILT